MKTVNIRLADLVISVTVTHPETVLFLSDYLTEEKNSSLSVTVTPEDVDRERSLSTDGASLCTDAYLERLALYRSIAEALLDFDVLLMHGSALALDGECHLFTALSGTGKSTHARLWREQFGERVVMINDDKPLLRLVDGRFYAYGTPWCGKHSLQTNTRAPLSSIAILERSPTNRAERIDSHSALPTVISQLYRPADPSLIRKLLPIAEKLLSSAKLFRIGVNMEADAAITVAAALTK